MKYNGEKIAFYCQCLSCTKCGADYGDDHMMQMVLDMARYMFNLKMINKREGIWNMDKQINKVKKDLDKGGKAIKKGEKDTKKLLKMDKKFDKKIDKAEKVLKKKK